MQKIYAGIIGLDGGVDLAAFHVSANGVVAHLKWDHLLEVKHILNDDNAPKPTFIGILIGMFFLLYIAQLGYTYTNTELLIAVRTFENQ